MKSTEVEAKNWSKIESCKEPVKCIKILGLRIL